MPRKSGGGGGGTHVSSKKITMLLKLAINRIQIHRTKKLEVSNKNKREIAELLGTGKDELARVRTISIVFEDYLIEVFNTLELYCNTIIARMELMQATTKCPKELREAVCSIIYAAPYMEVEELTKLRSLFITKYGKKFPQQCVHNCCVNPKVVSRLQRNAPEDALVNYYLSSIAKKHNVDWAMPDVAKVTHSAPPLSQPFKVERIPTIRGPPGGGGGASPQRFDFPSVGQVQPGKVKSVKDVQPLEFPSVPTSGTAPHVVDVVDLEARLKALSPAGATVPSSAEASPSHAPATSAGVSPSPIDAGGATQALNASDLAQLDAMWSKADQAGVPPPRGPTSAGGVRARDSSSPGGGDAGGGLKAAPAEVFPYKGCEEAVLYVGSLVSDLDASSLFAAAGQLQSVDGALSTETSERELAKAAKRLKKATDLLSELASKDNPKQVDAQARKVAVATSSLVKATKAFAAVVPDPSAQQELLGEAKSTAIRAQQLIISCREGNAKRGDKQSQYSLLDAASKVSDALASLNNVCSTTAAEATEGQRALEEAKSRIGAVNAQFSSGALAGGSATAEDVVVAAREVAGANASLVMAKSQEELRETAMKVPLACQRLAVAAAGASPSAPAGAADTLAAAVRGTNASMEALVAGRIAGDQMASSLASSKVAAGVNNVVAAARAFPGGSGLTLAPRSSANLDEVAARELKNAVRVIEEAAAALASRVRPPARAPDAPITTEDVNEAILSAAQAIATAAGHLLSAAATSQAERLAGGKNPRTKHLYNPDPVWAEGLISAARYVVGTTQNLVTTANAASLGDVEEEKLVASARAVAAATAQLVAAERAKADPGSSSHQALEQCAKGIASATGRLVQAAKAATEKHEEDARAASKPASYGLTAAQVREIEAQTKILKMERELERARKDLLSIKKDKYAKAGAGAAAAARGPRGGARGKRGTRGRTRGTRGR